MSRPTTRAARRSTAARGTHAILMLGSILMLVPFAWMLLTSVKTMSEAVAVPPVLFPAEPQWGNYAYVFQLLDFGRLYVNTIVATVIRVASQLVLCAMAGYAFARLSFPGKNLLFALVLSVMMIPPLMYVIPKFLLMTDFGWVNTAQGWIVPGLFSAFGTFVMRQFFLTLPRELHEAAKIDGAGPFRTFFSIMLPLARSGLIALAIFVTLWSWNDFMWPLIVLNSPDKLPLSVGLAAMRGEHDTNFPAMMAGSVLAVLPMLVLFFILQKRFIEGLAFTGSKL